jgi:membrane-bound metal-dependent hydrolase YbcI (DUF457 family)
MLGIAGFGASVWYGEHSLHLHALPLSDLAMGMAVAAGAALAPDLDEHQSLGGRANPISDLPIFGGHRTRTHTLFAAAVVLGLALLCQRDRAAMAVFVGFTACTGSSVLLATVRRAGCFLSVPLGALAGCLSYRYLSAGWWLTAAAALPYLSHLAADAITVGGVPLLMPFSKHRFSLGLMKTGHAMERLVFTPLIVVMAGVTTWGALVPSIEGLHVPGLVG